MLYEIFTQLAKWWLQVVSAPSDALCFGVVYSPVNNLDHVSS